MSLTHTLLRTYKTNAGTIVSVSDVFTDDFEITVDHEVAASTTNAEIDIALTFANIKCMVLYSDQTVTLKTNSTGAPGDTIAMVAKNALIWDTKELHSCPITSNVTKFFVTNSNTSAANFQARFLLDQVP